MMYQQALLQGAAQQQASMQAAMMQQGGMLQQGGLVPGETHGSCMSVSLLAGAAAKSCSIRSLTGWMVRCVQLCDWCQDGAACCAQHSPSISTAVILLALCCM
jgi:hypothetical protein